MTPHVVIVGGGFGGLAAARALAGAPLRVTLLDRRNHHLFQPLLYQVATGALNPADIASPIRSILRRQANAFVLLAEAVSIEPAARVVRLSDGSIEYDHLILACGARHSYFGHDGWEADAPGLKTIEDALDIRRRVFYAFEAAEREPDVLLREEWLRFVIVGGGPTGVELAGALAEIALHCLRRDFRNIDPSKAEVLLLEGGPRILQAFAAPLSEAAQRSLAELGVRVRAGKPVTAIDAGGVVVDGERIAARTVLWAAGVAASPLARSLGVVLDRAGRVRVEPDLSVPGYPEIAVIGDLAAIEQDGRLVPGVAPAAVQMGRHAARNLLLRLERKSPLPFRYVDKGSFATIGRGRAVGELGERVRVTGQSAWLAWLGIHLLFLIGFKNKLFVLLGWAYSYVSFRRGARLITGAPPSRSPAPPPEPAP